MNCYFPCRKQSKCVTRMFTGFRKISLDDLRKSHIVRDVQQYILCRLDQEDGLRQHLSRDTAEMLNQLHIKSNGCFLYLEKVIWLCLVIFLHFFYCNPLVKPLNVL
jgi:hypothetical protein